MSVGENIKYIRQSRGLSQAQLTERIGITQATMSLIEKGIRNPSLQTAAEIARVLEVRIEDLLKEGR